MQVAQAAWEDSLESSGNILKVTVFMYSTFSGSSWLLPSLPRTLLTSLSAFEKTFLITLAEKFLRDALACLSFTRTSESIGIDITSPAGVSDTDLVAADADEAGVIHIVGCSDSGHTLSSLSVDGCVGSLEPLGFLLMAKSVDGCVGSSEPLGFLLMAKTAEVRVDNLRSMTPRDDASLPTASSTSEHYIYKLP